jgi:PAS domain S-box-containing protein
MGSPTGGNQGTPVPDLAPVAAAFDALPTAVLVADAQGTVRFVNRALRALTGMTAEELTADAGLRDLIRSVLASDEDWQGAWPCPRKAAPAFEGRLTVTRTATNAGEVYAVATVDAAVTPGERDFELFFNLIPDLACIAHQDGYFKRVNSAWEKTLGYTPEEVLSRPFVEFVHPDDRESTLAEAGRQNRLYRTQRFVNRYRAKDGSYHLLEWATTFNRDEVTRFGVAHDVTERRRWEESLLESEQRFRILADSCPTIIWVTGADGRIRLTNRTCREFFGVEFAETDCPAPAALIHPDDRDAYVARFRDAVERRNSFRAEARMRRADGAWRWIASYAEPRLSGGGEFLGHAGISADFTERKQAEEEMYHAKLSAEAANRAKSEFLANMSHEIRTPMNAVLGLTGLALGTELTADQRTYLDGVKDAAESLLGLLNDILDLSKIEAGRLEFETVEFDIRRLLESTAKVLGVRASSKGLELATEIAPDVPARLLGDPARLRQILVNLMGNAIKFTDAGSVKVLVERVAREGPEVELHFRIQDTGIGIPREKQDLVFRPFVQADSSTTRRFGGTGLGLTISSQLAARMNGRLWVESEEGQGSTFHFSACFGAAAETASAPRAVPAGGNTANGHATLRVLVVEDNPVNRLVATRLIEMQNHVVAAVTNGKEALERLEVEAFDCILMDVQMPVMDGFEATAAIRRRERETGGAIPVIAMTAHAMAGDLERCLTAGMNAYVTKPVNAADLFAAIDKALRESRPES